MNYFIVDNKGKQLQNISPKKAVPNGNPKVSIACITYNHEQYIKECLEGFLMQQTNFSFEVIVGEDCSTDNTGAIILEYAHRYPEIFKPIFHEENVGAMANAYKYVLPACKGEYIAFCEGDDYWIDALKIQKQSDFLDRNPTCNICSHDWVSRNENTPITVVREDKREYRTSKIDIEVEAFGSHIATATLMVRRTFFDNLPSWFHESPNADLPVIMLAGKKGGMGFIHECMAVYRQHEGGVWTGMTEEDRFVRLIKVLSLLQREFSDSTHIQYKILHSMLGHHAVLLQKGNTNANEYIEESMSSLYECYFYLVR